ncbi:MAG TPA: DUF1707 domain-containing protein [Gemmatimonadaceae bacterium]|nr:DUF1707 domain-containing protein [Gemmatimonadaceae bacterium]
MSERPLPSRGDADPQLVALRERVIAQLGNGYARDRLDTVELERRLELAVRSRDAAELSALVADLPASQGAPPPSSRRPGQVLWAMLGGVSRRGAWMVPRRLVATAIMGGIELDLRDADLAPGVTEIRVYAIMGGVQIIAPPDVRLECEGVAILGGFQDQLHAPATLDPSAPLVRVKGVAIMGGVDVKVREPGEPTD